MIKYTKEKMINIIKDYILELYESIYNKRIDIEDKEDGYILKLYLTEDILSPFRMYIQCSSEDEFLRKVKDELQKRSLNLTKYFVGYKLDLNEQRFKKRIQGVSDSESKSSHI